MSQEKAGQLHASWQAVIGDEFNKPYMQELRTFLSQEKAAGKTIYPPSPGRAHSLAVRRNQIPLLL